MRCAVTGVIAGVIAGLRRPLLGLLLLLIGLGGAGALAGSAAGQGLQGLGLGACITDSWMVVRDSCAMSAEFDDWITAGGADILQVDDDGDGDDDLNDLDSDGTSIIALAPGTASFLGDDGETYTFNVLSGPMGYINVHDSDLVLTRDSLTKVDFTVAGLGKAVQTGAARNGAIWWEVFAPGLKFQDHNGIQIGPAIWADEEVVVGNAPVTPMQMVPGDGGIELFKMYEEGFRIDTTGVEPGDYTIQLRVVLVEIAQDTAGTDLDEVDSKKRIAEGDEWTQTITVGDAGIEYQRIDLGLGTGEDAVADGARDTITVVANAQNTLANQSNAGTLNRLTVVAKGGTILSEALMGAGADAATQQVSWTTTALGGSLDLGKLDGAVPFEVGALDGSQATTVTVQLFGADSEGRTLRSRELTLTFTGPPAELTLAEGVQTVQAAAAWDVNVPISAVDSAGNSAKLDGDDLTSLQVVDANGAVVSTDVEFEADANGDGTEGDFALTAELPANTGRGTYTVQAALDGVADSQALGSILVIGPAANVAVSLDTSGGTTLGSIITATITVTDGDGSGVSDATQVYVTTTGGFTLVGAQPNTAGGVTTRSLVVTGTGTAALTVHAGFTVNSMTNEREGGVFGAAAAEVGGEAPRAAAPADVDALTATSGFGTWDSDTPGEASALWPALANRGATSLYLWNGVKWLRYAELNGTPVPGAVDFFLLRADVIYIGQ